MSEFYWLSYKIIPHSVTMLFDIFCFRERIIRLQHENKMLKLKQGETTDEKSELLQSLLDDANARKNELESENR